MSAFKQWLGSPPLHWLIRPQERWVRLFRLSLIIGLCLLPAGWMVSRHNARVDGIRQDVGSTAWSMRQDITMGTIGSGGVLIFCGMCGLIYIRTIRGSWAQSHARYAITSAYIFAWMYLPQACFAALYAPSIYDVSSNRPGVDPLASATYRSIKIWMFLGACVPFLVFSVLGVLRYIKGPAGSAAPLRPCAECGYDLTGNVSGRCPECGTATSVMGVMK